MEIKPIVWQVVIIEDRVVGEDWRVAYEVHNTVNPVVPLPGASIMLKGYKKTVESILYDYQGNEINIIVT